ELELRTARERVGRLGEGLLAGPVGFALGVELERVWVCGLAEGLFPAVPHGDPLLADDDRAALDGALRLASDRVDDDHRALLGALASTAGARVCSYPRGDLRRSTERVASRFLAPTVEHVGDLARTIPSYAHALARVAFPPNEHELAVQGAIAGCEWVRALPETARGIEATAARASDEFTRFDGNLAPLGERLQRVSPVRAGAAIAPTRLEAWAACPHAYFVGSILHVDVAERPEEIWQLAPVDRGQLVHEVLDEFVGEVRDRAGAGRPWTSSDRARLHELAHAACARAEVRGVTGRRLLWDRDRRLIVSELDAFLDADTEYRTERDACTLATELAFGIHGASAPTVEVPLGANRVLHVRGKADRVDRRADGSLVVIDYKTGSPDAYTALGHDDPVLGGTRLQLPVYARAARAAFGEAGTAVAAFYWFVGRGNNRLIGYDVDAEVDAAFESVVGAIVDGIEGGVFVANPPPPGPRPFVICPYCDPDGLGTAQRWREWEHKYDAPELAPYRALLDPASEAGDS
ncbi:MAG TPA: PD-(D/E)XK nuclease family protein, partial [Acidimicrobiia bacterium]|nr:PD-(D/E)XK nuclease family protein [Acidimicrobiia bacterium]